MSAMPASMSALPDLCAAAGLRLRLSPPFEANFAAVLPVIRALLEMRRAGLFQAIWVDGMKLRVQYAGQQQRSNLSWEAAGRLAAQFALTCESETVPAAPDPSIIVK